MKNSVIVILFFLTVFVSCNETKNSKNDTTKTSDKDSLSVEVKKKASLFDNLSITPLTIKINNDSVTKITTPSGTEIVIPSQTFVDADGKLVSEKVRFEYKEIRTIADMLVENVNMQYDSAGSTVDFQTAGMFEMKAYVGNEPVFIKEGKSIEVAYKSDVKGNYNFYSYKKDNWAYDSRPLVEKVSENSNSVAKNLPLRPIKANPKEDLIINLDVDYKHISQLKGYDNIIWKYAGDKDKSEVKEILGKYINDKKLQATNKQSVFKFMFKIGKKEQSLLLSPVFTGKSFKNAERSYNNFVSSNTSNSIRRKVAVTRLGLMNYDRIYHRSDARKMLVNFEVIDAGEKINTDNLPIFHITGNDDVLIQQKNNNQMYYTLAMKNKLIAILPENKVAVLSSDGFVKQVDNSSSTTLFTLKTIDKTILDPSDLDEIISSL